MSQKISLKEAERRAFRLSMQDGLADIFIGCFFLMFAFAPPLSRYLGDFWSSALFLPVWGVLWLALRRLRRNVVTPRLGRVQFGSSRKSRLTTFSLAMLAINIVALVAGVVAWQIGSGDTPDALAVPSFLSVTMLIGFTVSGYYLDAARLYFYGVLAAAAPLIGEWLYQNYGAAHHGFPITFGFTAAIMLLVGLVLFTRLMQSTPGNISASHEETHNG